MENKTIIGPETVTRRRVLRVTGILYGTGEIKTFDYVLPTATRLFKNVKDVGQVAAEFYRISDAVIIDETVTTRAVVTQIVDGLKDLVVEDQRRAQLLKKFGVS